MSSFRTPDEAVLEGRGAENKLTRDALELSKSEHGPRTARARILFLGNSYNPLSVVCLQAVVDAGHETIVGSLDPLDQGARDLLRRSLKNRGWSGVLNKTGQLIRSKTRYAARRLGLPLDGFASLPELIHARGLNTIRCADPNSREFIRTSAPATECRPHRYRSFQLYSQECAARHSSRGFHQRPPVPLAALSRSGTVLLGSRKLGKEDRHYCPPHGEQIDSGDIILQRDFEIRPNENVSALTKRCAVLGERTRLRCDTRFDDGNFAARSARFNGGKLLLLSTKGNFGAHGSRSRPRLSFNRPAASRQLCLLRRSVARPAMERLSRSQHPRASVFHSIPWLQALRRTYQFEPVVFTTTPPGDELRNGVVFCRVNSWITGRRLVSLPFSDHCEPLVDSSAELDAICANLKADRKSDGWRYIEIRPAIDDPEAKSFAKGFQPFKQYYLHTIDLEPEIEQITRRFHKSSIQFQIRRAERRGLRHECGRSDFLFEKFYELLLLARRRHLVPPPPVGMVPKSSRSFGRCASDSRRFSRRHCGCVGAHHQV